ncbi:ROK family protein [Actinokineospora soli]|uniref:ROK family protein n=1 Tax=Actinokineospora soli TaxID=1048753 RepID=A0ABW2TJM2_9PSEU
MGRRRGHPGIVDRDRAEVVLAPSIPGWAGLPALARLTDDLGCPVLLDNDVNLAVLAERWRGEAADNLVFVQWGERIGSGIVIDGKPYRGASAAAGELGFVDLVTPIGERPQPPSDGLGAFERLVGARAIHALAAEAVGADLVADGLAPLFAAAEAGDPAAAAWSTPSPPASPAASPSSCSSSTPAASSSAAACPGRATSSSTPCAGTCATSSWSPSTCGSRPWRTPASRSARSAWLSTPRNPGCSRCCENDERPDR